MRWQPGNAQHIGSRAEQQDSFGFSDPSDRPFVEHAGLAAVVADGMGGMANGGAASAAAVRGLLDAYRAKTAAESIPDALVRSINSANDAVTRLCRATGVKNTGTTLAAIVLHQDWLYWVAAGDSRVYLYSEGILTRLTKDHVYAIDLDTQVAQGVITPDQAVSDPKREALTSYLGLETLPYVDRSVRPFPVKPGDCVLVCSDGLYRSLSEEEIAGSLETDGHNTCETLVDRAVSRHLPAQDNITVIAVKCRAEEPVAGRMATPLVSIAALAVLIAASFEVWRRSIPVIEHFNVDHAQIEVGQSAILRWSASHGNLTILPDIGRLDRANGARPVSPPRKTVYTLTAKNLFGSAQRSLAVDVLPSVAKQPVITLFEASPHAIKTGQPVVLKWSVQDAGKVSIEPAPDTAGLSRSGTRKVSPKVTTTYTLTAMGNGESAIAKTTVTVAPAPTLSLTIVRFVSDKSDIPVGGSATLKWAVIGYARSLGIDHGIGKVKAEGTCKVTPSSKTTYTLTAVARGGEPVTAAATVNVLPAPRIDRFEAAWDGQVWKLHWAVSGPATRISIQPDIGVVSSSSPPDGLPLKSPSADRYTLTAVGTGGSISKDVPLQPAADTPR